MFFLSENEERKWLKQLSNMLKLGIMTKISIHPSSKQIERVNDLHITESKNTKKHVTSQKEKVYFPKNLSDSMNCSINTCELLKPQVNLMNNVIGTTIQKCKQGKWNIRITLQPVQGEEFAFKRHIRLRKYGPLHYIACEHMCIRQEVMLVEKRVHHETQVWRLYEGQKLNNREIIK